MGIIGVDSHVRDMYGDSHSQGTCVLLEIPSVHKLVQYFQKQASRASVHNSITRGAARGDIFARHLAAHQRIWN